VRGGVEKVKEGEGWESTSVSTPLQADGLRVPERTAGLTDSTFLGPIYGGILVEGGPAEHGRLRALFYEDAEPALLAKS